MMPPQLLVCPNCRTLVRWMPAHYILYQLELGSAFLLIYCPTCDWQVMVDEAEPEDEFEEWPF